MRPSGWSHAPLMAHTSSQNNETNPFGRPLDQSHGSARAPVIAITARVPGACNGAVQNAEPLPMKARTAADQ